MSDIVRIKKLRQHDDLASVPDGVLILGLNNRYSILNEKWAAAEADLKLFPIPHFVSYCCEDDGTYSTYLGFVKVKGAWRICWGDQHRGDPDREGNYEWCPIAESSLDTRINAVKYFPSLRKAVKEAAAKTVSEIDHAIEMLELALI